LFNSDPLLDISAPTKAQLSAIHHPPFSTRLGTGYSRVYIFIALFYIGRQFTVLSDQKYFDGHSINP